MNSSNFLPILSPNDIAQAANLIQQAYNPQGHGSVDQRQLQQELFEIQKRPEAWGLVVPFLQHPDPNVQFFGAHTAQVKIARDWATFPHEHVFALRDLLLDLTGQAISNAQNKVTLRKLFVAITSLALKICSQPETQWPEWLLSSVQSLSSRGANAESLLNFLEIVAEEVESADLLASHKTVMHRSLIDAVPMVIDAIMTCVSKPRPRPSVSELRSALKCFEAWLPFLPTNNLTPVIPSLILLLSPISQAPTEFVEEEFLIASDALQEIMSRSALHDGGGSKTLTEPLLLWMHQFGGTIAEETVTSGTADAISHSFCKLLCAIGDHSTNYLAANLASSSKASPVFPSGPIQDISSLPSRSELVHTYLKLLLVYTSLPGYYGVDEEESEMTLGFWYLFQEALWNMEADSEDGSEDAQRNAEKDQWNIAKAVYSELVQVLRRKVVWPGRTELNKWTRDSRDKFQTYRRDVGDTLINACYILREDMLAYYINDLTERLMTKQESQGWEEIEATLHCIMAVQEAVAVEENEHLSRLFSSDVLSRLPSTGNDRVRRTTVLLIGSYASWFTTQPVLPPGSSSASLLMNAISYVVSALPEPSLCLPAANALRNICDSNRTALAPHINAFGELHAGITGIPDSEKSKVLQSIASVVQALPPEEEIPPIEAIMNPIVAKLFDVLQSSAFLPDEARCIAVQQLLTIAGVARGLTRVNDTLLIFDDSPENQTEYQQMKQAREDPRVVRLRDAILNGIRRTIDLWSTDASISDAISDLYKAITALPTDTTLLSLSPEPLLELICVAVQKQLTSVWLSLAQMLIIQLNPPTILPTLFKPIPSSDADTIVLNVLGVLSQTTLSLFSQPGAMEANPDIVQDFFGFVESTIKLFISTFYRLPPEIFNAIIQCAVSALSLQERYSLVSACNFLGTLINRTVTTDELNEARELLVQTHCRNVMQALLNGFAGVAPRSVTPNLIELLSTLVTRFPLQSRAWITEILYSDNFTQSKATPEAKEKFVKSIFSSKSLRRTREAAQQFTLVARGLEGSSFGYASQAM
ncbi:ARM repeat-containing protein [Abortiporus biennis]|nr:ARM repeat-containing protein [Abortiporus biennis]